METQPHSSANFEGGSGFLWVQKTSHSVLFPRNGLKNGNDMSNSFVKIFSVTPLSDVRLCSSILSYRSAELEMISSSFVTCSSLVRISVIFFFQNYVRMALLECER